MKRIEVQQFEALVTPVPAKIFTLGLGPCIGCAVKFKGILCLFHLTNAMHEVEVLDKWLEQIEANVTREEIIETSPLLAGGALVSEEEVAFGIDNEETEDCREFVVEKLTNFGFKATRTYWANEGEMHSIFLSSEDAATKLEIDVIGEPDRKSHVIWF
jgi:hypothetical protein